MRTVARCRQYNQIHAQRDHRLMIFESQSACTTSLSNGNNYKDVSTSFGGIHFRIGIDEDTKTRVRLSSQHATSHNQEPLLSCDSVSLTAQTFRHPSIGSCREFVCGLLAIISTWSWLPLLALLHRKSMTHGGRWRQTHSLRMHSGGTHLSHGAGETWLCMWRSAHAPCGRIVSWSAVRATCIAT